MAEYNDFPFMDCVKKADELMQQYPGIKIYQKFTCAGCGQRLTIDEPNNFHKQGSCDKCPAITDIEKQGCNYLVIFAAPVENRS